MQTTAGLLDEGPKSLHSPSLAANRPFHVSRVIGGLPGDARLRPTRGPEGPGPPLANIGRCIGPPCCFNLFLPLRRTGRKDPDA